MEQLNISKNVPHSLSYIHTLSKPLWLLQVLQSIGPSIHKSIHQSIDQSISQSIDCSILQSIDSSIHGSFDQSIHPSIDSLIHPSIHPSIIQSIYPLTDLSIDRSVSTAFWQSFTRPVEHKLSEVIPFQMVFIQPPYNMLAFLLILFHRKFWLEKQL